MERALRRSEGGDALTPFATGLVLGVFVGAGLALMAVLVGVWAWLETQARKENLHASFEKARRS